MKIIALEKFEIYGSPKKEEQRIPFQVEKRTTPLKLALLENMVLHIQRMAN